MSEQTEYRVSGFLKLKLPSGGEVTLRFEDASVSDAVDIVGWLEKAQASARPYLLRPLSEAELTEAESVTP